MKLEKIWAVYFSGTGTTRRTVERIAGGIASRLNLPAETAMEATDNLMRHRDVAMILATGGSAIYSEPAMNHLSEIGRVVYLKISFDELKCRLADFSERGVVMRDGIGMSLRDLYDERLPLYEKYADITVDVNDLSITAAARKVAAALK